MLLYLPGWVYSIALTVRSRAFLFVHTGQPSLPKKDNIKSYKASSTFLWDIRIYSGNADWHQGETCVEMVHYPPASSTGHFIRVLFCTLRWYKGCPNSMPGNAGPIVLGTSLSSLPAPDCHPLKSCTKIFVSLPQWCSGPHWYSFSLSFLPLPFLVLLLLLFLPVCSTVPSFPVPSPCTQVCPFPSGGTAGIFHIHSFKTFSPCKHCRWDIACGATVSCY